MHATKDGLFGYDLEKSKKKISRFNQISTIINKLYINTSLYLIINN